MSGDLDGMKAAVARLSAQFEQLAAWHEELRTARKHLVTATALEEQTLSIAGRLNEKWHENTDAILRLREVIENMSAQLLAMSARFDLVYEKLHDALNCPYPWVDRHSHSERSRQPPAGGGDGV